MPADQDRRRFKRYQFEKDVFCYIDGNRFDARTRDVSLGGMFLQADNVEGVHAGALVALVFKGGDAAMQSVFLFGRVARVEKRPTPGLAIRWQKAVAVRSPEILVVFLNRLFGLQPDAIRLGESRTQAGEARYTFVFGQAEDPVRGPAAADGASPMGQPPSPALPAGAWVASLDPGIRNVEVRVVPTAAAADTAPDRPLPGPLPTPPRDRAPGAITTQIDSRTVRVPTATDATMEVEGFAVPIRIVEFGVASMVVSTRMMPVDPKARVRVAIDVLTRDGKVPIRFVCSRMPRGVGGPSANGILLEIVEVDEGKVPGIFMRYLKWLHFHSLAEE